LLKRQQIGSKMNKVERSTLLNFQVCCRFVAGSTKSTVLNSTLLPVSTGLYTPERQRQQEIAGIQTTIVGKTSM